MYPAFIKVNFIDIIDILLVAFLLYQIYMLIKGTIATYIFITVITFYVLWLLVRDSMLLLGSILGQIIGVGAIVLIVVFQQEIRRFLIMFGARYFPKLGLSIDNLFYKAGTGFPVINVNAVTEACSKLSTEKTGALIVLKRTTMLDNYINTGEILDARISSNLLYTIFDKHSPLHDGAVIINNDKIYAAGCVLPLSDSYDLPSHLGLRHRAALGLSEQTDALIIVVSEETGDISLAESGRLTRINAVKLSERLDDEFLKVSDKFSEKLKT